MSFHWQQFKYNRFNGFNMEIFILLQWTLSIAGSKLFGRLLLSRPNKASFKCPSVRPSVKSFFDFNELWCVGRGRQVMHDSMHCAVWPDPRSRSRALERRKFDHFKRLSPPPFTMGAGKWPRILKFGEFLKLIGAGFFIFVPVYVSRDFEVGSK